MAKIAILKSQHLEVARLFEESLDEVLCMAGNPNAEDLLKVTDFTGKEYWCDEIEFINNIPEQKEVVINNVDKLVAEYCDSLLPHVNALCHKSILEIATWSYRQGVEEMIEKQGGHTDKIVEKAKIEKQRVLVTESDGSANIDWDTRSLEDARRLLKCGLQYINAELKKQGEQKTIDKVKPNFKVGEWVVQENIGVYKVIEICESWYEVIDNEDKHYSIGFDKKCMCHLWTIDDVRDGDVLTNGDCPCIFKSINEENAMFVYCGINGGGDFATKSKGKDNIWDDEPENYCPATKEQRDLLFAKMKETGYEWDAKKKELKKIEQSKLTEFEDAVKDMMDDYRDAIDANDATTEEVKERAAYMLSLIPHKPADWSEEDEKALKQLTRWLVWLKSLKERCAWKPSLAQMNALSIVSKGNAPDDMEAIVSLYNDLKKLKGE